jgi:hypothetical protein
MCAAPGLPSRNTGVHAVTTNIAVLIPALGFLFIGCAMVLVWTNSKNK